MTNAASHSWPTITALCVAAVVMVDRETARAQQARPDAADHGSDTQLQRQFLKMVKIIDGNAGMFAGFVAISPRPGASVNQSSVVRIL